ncbi:MAG: nitroreductase family protein [Steroidobacteraceae bacterium]
MPTVIPLPAYREYDPAEMLAKAREFAVDMHRRRTVRQFSARPVSREVIEQCLRAACSAPSGANMQPWRFVAVSDPMLKRRIRLAAEEEEREFYAHRASKEWLDALAPLGTDSNKPFLEIAPWLIAVFVERFGRMPDGRKVKHYYTAESVGLATGLLLAAVHRAGLVSLTHTPSPMGFLNEILGRPADLERPFLLLVVGFPASGAVVPDIQRKRIDEVVSWR